MTGRDLRRLEARDLNVASLRLVGKSAAMREVDEAAREVARGDWNVLIEGESGTEKELVARRIQVGSSGEKARSSQQTVRVCPMTWRQTSSLVITR
jgi:DNA-binding NtrC family response regulator